MSFYLDIDPSWNKLKKNRNKESITEWHKPWAVAQHTNVEAIIRR